MNPSSDRKPMSTLKKTALIGGGVLAAGAGGAALARLRKPKLRIGTPLSKATVINHMPIKTKQAKGRVVEMSARLDAVLHQFQAISTAEEPYSYGGDSYSGESLRKPNFPSLYLSRSTDKGLMKMQGEGQALINYRVKSRTVDENCDGDMPLYGASIEIRSIEPMASGEGGAELSETLFLREFAGGYVNTDEGVKKERGVGGHLTRHTGKYVGGAVLGPLGLAGGYFIDKKRRKDNVEDAKREVKTPWKSKGKVIAKDLSAPLFLRHFAVTRDRDGEGRYAAGNVPGADDYAIAAAAAPKKKMGLGKKVAIGAGAAGAAGAAAIGLRKASLIGRNANKLFLR